MALRFFLVAAVAALGLNPPSNEEFSRWSRAGQEWIAARLDDLSGSTRAATTPEVDEDFEVIVADMARDFSNDLAISDLPKSNIRITFEPIVVSDDLNDGVAFALNSHAGGEGYASDVVGPPEPLAWVKSEPIGPPYDLAVVVHELVGPPADLAIATDSSGEESIQSPQDNRATQFVSAVQLTRQAARAWIGLLNGPVDASLRR